MQVHTSAGSVMDSITLFVCCGCASALFPSCPPLQDYLLTKFSFDEDPAQSDGHVFLDCALEVDYRGAAYARCTPGMCTCTMPANEPLDTTTFFYSLRPRKSSPNKPRWSREGKGLRVDLNMLNQPLSDLWGGVGVQIGLSLGPSLLHFARFPVYLIYKDRRYFKDIKATAKE